MSIFRYQRNERLNRRFVFFILLLSVLILVFFFGPGKSSPSFFQHPVQFVGYLIESAGRSVINGVSGVWNGYLNLVHTQERYAGLARDYDVLKGENLRLKEMEAENERLRLLLGISPPVPLNLTAARVIMRDPTNWYQSLTIDKGSESGILPGMGVIAPDGVVGRVIRSGYKSAIVLLAIDRNSAVAVLIGRTRDEGILEGTSRGFARIKYISPDVKIEPGDQILTSGLTSTFPKGFAVGTVVRVARPEDPGETGQGKEGEPNIRASDPFLRVEVKPAVNFSRVEEVMVITSGGMPANPEDGKKR
ncbi:MAG TPA: rod shape-determining protein MreC [Nitrospiria bacterium]|nr:rod shape-determining protein MreC [Nitrospiria bacterium]